MRDLQALLKTLMQIEIVSLQPQDALDSIAILVDLAHDLGSTEATSRALEWCEALSGSRLSPLNAALLDYYMLALVKN